MYRMMVFFFLLMIVSCKNTISKNDSLVNEIDRMASIDQIAAYIPQGKYISYSREQWNKFKDSIFADNTKKAEVLYNKHGYLGFDKVGEKGEAQFWVIVQHSDNNTHFQNKVLNSLKKEVDKKNASPEHYALLYDRVKVNSGDKQLFGTQVDYNENGQAKPKIGLKDTFKVDKLRKQYNLDPLKEYLNHMTEMHFQMNKVNLEKRGIKQPILYK